MSSSVNTRFSKMLSLLTVLVLSVSAFAPFRPAASVLSKDLYYAARTGQIIGGIAVEQIYRLGKDGKTVTKITHENPGLGEFDISPRDGTIAYGLGHEVITVDPNGSHRTVLIHQADDISYLVWSPDGNKIAYQAKKSGLYLYTLATRQTRLLEAKTTNPDYLTAPFPLGFSPDGNKLLFTNFPGGNAFYNFASKTLTPMANVQTGCCFFGEFTWASSDSILSSVPVISSGGPPGLWRVNSQNGSVQTLLPRTSLLFELAAAARQTPDGKLIYLYSQDDGISYPGKPLPAFSLVRSARDGLTNRVTLRPEKFQVRDAVWTPDNTGVVILNMGRTGNKYTLLLVPVNPTLPVKTILANAINVEGSFHWGN